MKRTTQPEPPSIVRVTGVESGVQQTTNNSSGGLLCVRVQRGRPDEPNWTVTMDHANNRNFEEKPRAIDLLKDIVIGLKV